MECVEGMFSEVRRSKRPLRRSGKHPTTARWRLSDIETERLLTIPSYELPEEQPCDFTDVPPTRRAIMRLSSLFKRSFQRLERPLSLPASHPGYHRFH
jgi:hypothetical protein